MTFDGDNFGRDNLGDDGFGGDYDPVIAERFARRLPRLAIDLIQSL
jgi:hypothetical protein